MEKYEKLSLNHFTHFICFSETEPPHDKANKVTRAPSEDSDQPGHPPSLIRGFAVRFLGRLGPNAFHAHSEDSDQTGRMPRLI